MTHKKSRLSEVNPVINLAHQEILRMEIRCQMCHRKRPELKVGLSRIPLKVALVMKFPTPARRKVPTRAPTPLVVPTLV